MILQSELISLSAFQVLLEFSQDVFWIRDMDYQKQIYVNPAYETVWGRTCSSLYQDGLSWFSAIHDEDKESVEAEIKRIKRHFSNGKPHELSYRIICPNGEIRVINEIVLPWYDKQRQPMGYVGVAKDVSPKKYGLTKLEQGAKFLQLFTDKVNLVFWATDITCHKQLYLSPGFEKIWGRNPASLYEDGASWSDTLHPEDRVMLSDRFRLETLHAKDRHLQHEWRYRIYRPDGKIRWIKDTSFPLQDENNNFIGFAGIAEDVTEKCMHEQQLRDAIQCAETANQVKSDFLAMMSHELRTPLNAILGMSQILTSRGLPTDLQKFVDIISNAGNDLLSLISDFLDFAKLEAGNLSFVHEPFNLRIFFSQLMQELHDQANEKGIKLLYHFSSNDTDDVLGDAQRIRQILLNLIGNAFKFTDNGYIKISIDCIEKNKNKAIFEVAIEDTGIGIQQDKLNLVFEKFSQVDSIYRRKHSGTGLGLAITKKLVETMGGTIFVKSEYGVGSLFKFNLPLDLQEHTEDIRAAARKRMSSCQRYPLNILLVEDNPINQKIIKLMLEDFGCHVDVFDNGKAVLDNIHQLTKYHIIFMDIGLPDISGFDVVSQLSYQPELKKIPIIAITAHILDHDRQQALESGISRIIAKPINSIEIEAVLHEVARENFNC